jgi:hypothetical protein
MRSSYLAGTVIVALMIQNVGCSDDQAPATAEKREVAAAVPHPDAATPSALSEGDRRTLDYMRSLRNELLSAQRVYLYLLDGTSYPMIELPTPPGVRKKKSKAPDRRPRFHDYSIIRRVRVRDSESRRQLIDGMYAAIAFAESRSLCFEPVYGLRILSDGRTTDVLLARDCDRFEAHVNGVRYDGLMCGLPVEPFEAALKRER